MDVGSDSLASWGLSVWFACSPCACVGFLPQSKDMNVTLIDDLKSKPLMLKMSLSSAHQFL